MTSRWTSHSENPLVDRVLDTIFKFVSWRIAASVHTIIMQLVSFFGININSGRS